MSDNPDNPNHEQLNLKSTMNKGEVVQISQFLTVIVFEIKQLLKEVL